MSDRATLSKARSFHGMSRAFALSQPYNVAHSFFHSNVSSGFFAHRKTIEHIRGLNRNPDSLVMGVSTYIR